MKTALGLLLMLLKVSLGVETYCDGRLNGAQCYGALGGTAIIQLLNNSSEIYKFVFSNRTGTILSMKQGGSLYNELANRSVFTPTNGTFRIDMLSRSDDAQYTLEIYDKNGRREELRTLQLTIEAPVTSVRLRSECLSQGEKKVSCSSDGDSPQYSWTLDGDTLSDTDLLSGDGESNEITVKQNVSGQLICSVRNHVSSVSEGEAISTCGFIFIDCNLSNGTHISKWVFEANNTLCNEPTTTATSPTTVNDGHSFLILGLRTLAVILILSGIGIYFMWKKKKLQSGEISVSPKRMEHQDNSVMMAEL